MVRWGSITQNDEITKIPIPTVTGLCIGAVAGAIAWLIIYRLCPKPALLDKILDWLLFADRRGGPHHERPTTTTTAYYMTLNGNNNNGSGGPSRENIELQDHHRIGGRRRRGSPTETIETITSGSDLSTPEPPMLVSSEEESD